MISFVDEHRSVLGVEPICRLLPIAPSTYYEVVAKRTDVGRLSARERNDIAMKVEIRRVFNENFQVYGVRKVWRQLQREGFDIARCTVARLMRMMGLQGIIRGKPIKTTVSDKSGPCPLDRVNRHFKAPAPNMRKHPNSHAVSARADENQPVYGGEVRFGVGGRGVADRQVFRRDRRAHFATRCSTALLRSANAAWFGSKSLAPHHSASSACRS